MNISTLPTPALILDQGRLKTNIDRMNRRSEELQVTLRPHVKTAKCAAIAEMAVGPNGPITVSTIKEADYFFEHGFRDITYAVDITVDKLVDIAALQARGAEIKIILDSREIASNVVRQAKQLETGLKVLIEIDCGALRGGLSPDDPEIVAIARLLADGEHTDLVGVLTHAGHSYDAGGPDDIRQIAENERRAVVTAAHKIEAAGIACPVRSVGSTPTALFADNLEGITEMRPGVYVFGDVFQSCLGTCAPEDIAVSVLTSVISHKHTGAGFALIDAGGLALSKDLSAANRFGRHIGYGLVYDMSGQQAEAAITLDTTHQEHGWLRPIHGDFPFARFPLGTKLRIMPNHSCMMAAPYNRYYIVNGGDEVVGIWEKATGW